MNKNEKKKNAIGFNTANPFNDIQLDLFTTSKTISH